MDIRQIVDDITQEMEITWGGSGFERVVFEWIIQHVPKGSVAIELGAGFVSTKCLSIWCDLYSVESDERFTAEYPTKYIIAPKDGGYDWGKLAQTLPAPSEQKLILIDGVDRRSILDHMDLFNRDAVWVIHDTNREVEAQLAKDLAQALNKPITFHTEGDFWATI